MSVELLDSQGAINEELLGKDAIETAGKLENVVSSNNLRKFYDQFLKIYDSRAKLNEKRVMLLMMKAHIHYSAKRLKYFDFDNFIKERIDNVLLAKTDDDFKKRLKAFKLNFEAVVGYFKGK